MDMEYWALLMAAGQGSRLKNATGGIVKQFFQWNGAPLYWQSAVNFLRCSRLSGLVFVFSPECIESERERVISLIKDYELDLPYKVASGGELRQDSVRNALLVLPTDCTHVLIHDAARPFTSIKLINHVLDALETHVEGVVPGVPVIDTIKYVVQGEVESTPNRNYLFSIQTPQGFQLQPLIEGHRKAVEEKWIVTDDASLLEKCGYRVKVIAGEPDNRKITNPEDLKMLESLEVLIPLVGYGYDVHRYASHEVSGQSIQSMKLGGVDIPNAPGVLAHSDGDVLLHALIDALLGCIGEGDIGLHFPDTDKSYDGIDSTTLLERILIRVCNAQVKLVHIDTTIVAQVPKIGPYRDVIRSNISKLLNIDQQHVNIKATTEEGLGFTGEQKGIKAVVVVTAIKVQRSY